MWTYSAACCAPPTKPLLVLHPPSTPSTARTGWYRRASPQVAVTYDQKRIRDSRLGSFVNMCAHSVSEILRGSAARCWSRPALRRFPCSLSLRAQRRWTAPPLPRGSWTRCAMASFVNQRCSSCASPAGTRREPDAQVGAKSSTVSGGQQRGRRKRRGSRGLFAGSCACTPRDRHRDLWHLVLIQARGQDSREPPYETTTYVWELTKPVVFHEPVPYEHRQGVVVWARA